MGDRWKRVSGRAVEQPDLRQQSRHIVMLLGNYVVRGKYAL